MIEDADEDTRRQVWQGPEDPEEMVGTLPCAARLDRHHGSSGDLLFPLAFEGHFQALAVLLYGCQP